jgi:integrase
MPTNAKDPRRWGVIEVRFRPGPPAIYVGWSYPLSALNLRIAQIEGRPLAPWSLHDVRRTVRTGLGRLGVRPDVAERVVGHVRSGTVEAIYDRHSYRGEVAARWRDGQTMWLVWLLATRTP